MSVVLSKRIMARSPVLVVVLINTLPIIAGTNNRSILDCCKSFPKLHAMLCQIFGQCFEIYCQIKCRQFLGNHFGNLKKTNTVACNLFLTARPIKLKQFQTETAENCNQDLENALIRRPKTFKRCLKSTVIAMKSYK